MRRTVAVPIDAYKVLISGDREWTNLDIIRHELVALPSYAVIIHGAARGADAIADTIANELGLRSIRCPAHWQHNASGWCSVYGPCEIDCQEVSGRAAGALRNIWMLDSYQPDYLIAFHPAIDDSRGTRHAIREAEKRRIPGKLIGKME